jgi:hypothetical protein
MRRTPGSSATAIRGFVYVRVTVTFTDRRWPPSVKTTPLRGATSE